MRRCWRMSETYNLEELNEWADKIVDGLRNWVNEIKKAFNNNTTSICIDKLDFSEHDKVFEDKIAKLERQIKNYELKKRQLRTRCIESARDEFDKEMYGCLTIVKYPNELEAKADLDKPSAEWYENRHQQDCIEINRLNTTIDVLIHKIEYLRQFAGLE